MSEPTKEAEGVVWFDDYYTVEYIDEQTIAIGEPRYHQQNYSYLLLGTERALLFDTGPGVRNIKPVVDSLTALPITVSQSHLHYDHVGNHHQFAGAALPDLPYLRAREVSGQVPLKHLEHLGFVERIPKPVLNVTAWWPDQTRIDLGERVVILLHTPGHTKDSVVLLDADRQLLISGDFICPGLNGALLPGGDIEQYLASTRRLLAMTSPEFRLLTGHRDQASIEHGAPILGYKDLVDLEQALSNIIAGSQPGSGIYIRRYQINERSEFIVDR